MDGFFNRNVLLAGYGILSGTYRIVIFALIMSIFYQYAELHEMGDLVGVLVLLAMGCFFLSVVRTVMMPPKSHAGYRHYSIRRPVIFMCLLTAGVILVGLVPLPRTTTAHMMIQPADAKTVFVTNGGRLVKSVDNGSVVEAGQMIATLVNESVELSLHRLVDTLIYSKSS